MNAPAILFFLLLSTPAQPNALRDIGNAFKKVGNAIADVGRKAVYGTELAGLYTAKGAVEGSLRTVEAAQKTPVDSDPEIAARLAAYKPAKATLDGLKKTVELIPIDDDPRIKALFIAYKTQQEVLKEALRNEIVSSGGALIASAASGGSELLLQAKIAHLKTMKEITEKQLSVLEAVHTVTETASDKIADSLDKAQKLASKGLGKSSFRITKATVHASMKNLKKGDLPDITVEGIAGEKPFKVVVSVDFDDIAKFSASLFEKFVQIFDPKYSNEAARKKLEAAQKRYELEKAAFAKQQEELAKEAATLNTATAEEQAALQNSLNADAASIIDDTAMPDHDGEFGIPETLPDTSLYDDPLREPSSDEIAQPQTIDAPESTSDSSPST